MTPRRRILDLCWLAVLLLALTFIGWTASIRVERARYLTSLPTWSVARPEVDRASPTGYRGGVRDLILLGHAEEGNPWVAQTQQTLAAGSLRLRHTDEDNAPFGRRVDASAPYRAWLAFVAWIDRALHGRSLSESVETAALWSDPILHGILVFSAGLFAFRRFGPMAGILVIATTAASLPLAAYYAAAAPNSGGFTLLFVFWSAFPIFAALIAQGSDQSSVTRPRTCFVFAAIAGGIALWQDAELAWPIITSIAIAGALHEWLDRKSPQRAVLPWRLWGLTGCLVSLIGYLAEYFPGEFEFSIRGHHPAFALAWAGMGEAITQFSRISRAGWDRSRADIVRLLVALAVAAIGPVFAVLTSGRGWISESPLAMHFPTALFDGQTFGALSGNLRASAWIMFLLLVALAAFAPLALRKTNPPSRTPVGLVLTCFAAVVVAAALLQLRTFAAVNIAALIALIVLCTGPRLARLLAASLAGAITVLGVFQLWPERPVNDRFTLVTDEVQKLIARDVALWLAQREEASVVLAPPELTRAIHFHGGIRGVCTLAAENREGISAAIRIMGATSPDETLELLSKREITHVVLPSWDPLMESFAEMAGGQRKDTFLAALRGWSLPTWAQPVPYTVPSIEGIEAQSVTVFRITEPQDEATALARTVEYLLETGDRPRAIQLASGLKRFPTNPAALAALAQASWAAGHAADAAAAMEALTLLSGSPGALRIPWDRRVSVASTFAQGRSFDLARTQMAACWRSANEDRLRRLSDGSLRRMLAISDALKVESPAELHAFARAWLRK